MKAGQGISKRTTEIGKASRELLDHLRSGCQSKNGGDLIYEVEREYIREV